MIEIPLIAVDDQRFSIVLSGRRVTLRIRRNKVIDRFMLDLSLDGKPVLTSKKMTTGVDLLSSYNFGIGKIFLHSQTNAVFNEESLANKTVRLYHKDA